MPAKIILSLVTLALVGGAALLALTGNVVLIVLGVIVLAVAVLFATVAVRLLGDPSGAAERLLARRNALEARKPK